MACVFSLGQEAEAGEEGHFTHDNKVGEWIYLPSSNSAAMQLGLSSMRGLEF